MIDQGLCEGAHDWLVGFDDCEAFLVVMFD
jgi:hypothetical protein